jgi:hypothetical protein
MSSSVDHVCFESCFFLNSKHLNSHNCIIWKEKHFNWKVEALLVPKFLWCLTRSHTQMDWQIAFQLFVCICFSSTFPLSQSEMHASTVIINFHTHMMHTIHVFKVRINMTCLINLCIENIQLFPNVRGKVYKGSQFCGFTHRLISHSLSVPDTRQQSSNTHYDENTIASCNVIFCTQNCQRKKICTVLELKLKEISSYTLFCSSAFRKIYSFSRLVFF